VLHVVPTGLLVEPAGTNEHPFTARHDACVRPVQAPVDPWQFGDQKHPPIPAHAM
jgi:hypothetical protein